MVYATQVVNETLRMANIIGGIFRRAMTDIDIKGNNHIKRNCMNCISPIYII